MRRNLITLGGERFEELCQALLQLEIPRFQAFSPPDGGMDGYDSDTKTIYQVYFPEREPRRDKIAGDLAKAMKTLGEGGMCDCWILLIPKNPTRPFTQWFERLQPEYPFKLEVWGKTKIEALLTKHKPIRDTFFPTELRDEIRRWKKGKWPKPGDAEPAREISAEQREELRGWINKLAEQEAKKKRRGLRRTDFENEYGELLARFKVSSYDLLPSDKFLDARRYLNEKYYARRQGQTQIRERFQKAGGIHAIQKDLHMGDKKYRALLRQLTGKTSTEDMDIKELRKVFKYFRERQDAAQVSRLDS